MRSPVLVVEHAASCPPARFGRWLEGAGCVLDVRRPYTGEELPVDLGSHRAMLVLGGPMGAEDDEQHPWLAQVKELIRVAVTEAVPTLGICLGHQLAAVALGGRIERNPRGRQVGLIPTGWTADASRDPLLGPLTTPRRGIHWNDDVVAKLPGEAVLLARTPYDEVQAARFAPTVWGVQLHPEADAQVVRTWVDEEVGSHAGGTGVEARLAEVAAAHEVLEADWRPLAVGLAGLAARRAGR